MKYCLILLLLIISINCYEEDNGITILKDDNYAQAIKEFPNIIVKMYAPWCTYCQALEPEYIEAAKIALEAKMPIRFAQIDLTANQKTAQEQNVEGYPTIKLYQSGKSIEFYGERKTEDILNFMKKKLYGSVFKFSTLIEIDEFTKKTRVVLMSTITESSGEKKEYYTAADTIEDNVDFIECISGECKAKYTAPIVMIRDYNKDTIVFPYKEISHEKITKFIEWYSIEQATLLTDETIQSLFQYNKTAIVLFRDDKDEKQKELDVIMKRIANEYMEKLHVILMNAKGDDINQRASEYFFVAEDTQPQIQIIVISGIEEKNYMMRNKEITEENIKQFILDFTQGKIIKEPLSEAINPYSEGIITLVGRNFVKEVIESDKAIFVLFKTEDTAECAEYTNSWNEMGQKYSDSNDVKFGAINMKANEVYELSFDVYPVMRLYLLNKKDSPIEYKGSSNIIDIEEWMAWKFGWANEPISLPNSDL